MKPINDIAFCLNNLNRCGEIRGDDEKLGELLHSVAAKIILFKNLAPLLQLVDGELIPLYLPLTSLPPTEKMIFLGMDADDNPYFAGQSKDEALMVAGGEFLEIRQNMMRINARDISILGTARSILAWHNTHSYCSGCGHKSLLKDGGWKRICDNCRTEHFPRTDPVAIMTIHYGDKCLLARSINFPEGLYSNLAGFIEPGETLEQGCAREVLEEVGLEIEDIQIIGNQPWSNPYQLMIGMIARAKSDKITINPDEVVAANWFSRDEVRQLLAHGLEIDGKPCFGPRPAAIAYHLLQYWLERTEN